MFCLCWLRHAADASDVDDSVRAAAVRQGRRRRTVHIFQSVHSCSNLPSRQFLLSCGFRKFLLCAVCALCLARVLPSCLGRGCSQSRCPTTTDRDPATEIADRVGRSVGAQAPLAPVHTPKRQSQRAAGADFEAKTDEKQPFHAIFRSKIACGAR